MLNDYKGVEDAPGKSADTGNEIMSGERRPDSVTEYQDRKENKGREYRLPTHCLTYQKSQADERDDNAAHTHQDQAHWDRDKEPEQNAGNVQ